MLGTTLLGGCEALGRAAQGRGGVPSPGGISEMHGRGTEGHDVVMGPGRSGLWLDLLTLKDFSNLDDSMI